MAMPDARLYPLSHAALGARGLHMLVLFGSRARGDHQPDSDWNFGYVADASFNVAQFTAIATAALGTERVNFVDLTTARSTTRMRAAGDGIPLYEVSGDDFARYKRVASAFWSPGQVVREIEKAFAPDGRLALSVN